MDFSLDVAVLTSLKKLVTVSTAPGMQTAVTHYTGLALKYLQPAAASSSGGDVEYAAVDPTSATTTQVLLILSWLVGILAASILGYISYCMYQTWMRDFRLDLLHHDDSFRKDVIAILEMCEKLFDYEVELDDEGNPIRYLLTNLGHDPDVAHFNDIHGQKLATYASSFNSADKSPEWSTYREDVDQVWRDVAACCLHREPHDVNTEGALLEGTLLPVKGMMTHQWLQRAEHVLLLLRPQCEGCGGNCITSQSWCGTSGTAMGVFDCMRSGGLLERFIRIGLLEEKVVQLRHLLTCFVGKLRFMLSVTQPHFLTDACIQSHTIQKTNPSFRERLYYTTMHTWDGEVMVLWVQVSYYALASLPGWCFIAVFNITTRDLNWGMTPPSEGQFLNYFLIAFVSHFCISWWVIVLYNVTAFGGPLQPAEVDRSVWHFWKVRSKPELIKSGLRDGSNFLPYRGMWSARGTLQDFTSCGADVEESLQEAHPDDQFYTIFTARIFALFSEIWAILYFACFLLFVVLGVVICLWIILGVFVYPEKFLPWATAILAVTGHVIKLSNELASMKDRLETEIENEIEKILRGEVAQRYDAIADKVNSATGLDMAPDAEQLLSTVYPVIGLGKDTSKSAMAQVLDIARATTAFPAQVSSALSGATDALALSNNPKGISAVVERVRAAIGFLESMSGVLRRHDLPKELTRVYDVLEQVEVAAKVVLIFMQDKQEDLNDKAISQDMKAISQDVASSPHMSLPSLPRGAQHVSDEYQSYLETVKQDIGMAIRVVNHLKNVARLAVSVVRKSSSVIGIIGESASELRDYLADVQVEHAGMGATTRPSALAFEQLKNEIEKIVTEGKKELKSVKEAADSNKQLQFLLNPSGRGDQGPLRKLEQTADYMLDWGEKIIDFLSCEWEILLKLDKTDNYDEFERSKEIVEEAIAAARALLVMDPEHELIVSIISGLEVFANIVTIFQSVMSHSTDAIDLVPAVAKAVLSLDFGTIKSSIMPKIKSLVASKEAELKEIPPWDASHDTVCQQLAQAQEAIAVAQEAMTALEITAAITGPVMANGFSCDGKSVYEMTRNALVQVLHDHPEAPTFMLQTMCEALGLTCDNLILGIEAKFAPEILPVMEKTICLAMRFRALKKEMEHHMMLVLTGVDFLISQFCGGSASIVKRVYEVSGTLDAIHQEDLTLTLIGG